jgi:hypothetical protein
MRRRLQKYLPIVLVALLVQILAPIAASWAAAMVASDPLGAAEICHSLPISDTTQNDQGADHRAHGACPICCVAQAGSSLDTPKAIVVAMPYRAAALVAWRDQVSALARAQAGSNAQARAPPLSM